MGSTSRLMSSDHVVRAFPTTEVLDLWGELYVEGELLSLGQTFEVFCSYVCVK